MGELKLNTFIDKYQVISIIGKGKFSVVYLVELGGSKFALKLLNDTNHETLIRFRKEIAALARVSHENLVKIHNVGEYEGFPYMVMEYLQGQALDSFLSDSIKLETSKAVEITKSVVRALGEINKSNLVHRDVKPANIIIAGSGIIKLIDLGLVGDVEHIKADKAYVGTPIYSSPEQSKILNRPVEFSSDFYSVGITLYELLVGTPPFSGSLNDILQAHASKIAPDVRESVPEVPRALSLIIKKMIAKDPDDRYKTAYGLLYDLDHIGEFEEAGISGAPIKLGTKDQKALSKGFAFVEKKREMGELLEAWKSAQSGTPQIAFAFGPSGSGKSKICEAFLDGVDRKKTLVLRAKCQFFDRDLPFGSLREALNFLIEDLYSLSDEERQEIHTKLQKAAIGCEAHICKLLDGMKAILNFKGTVTDDLASVEDERKAYFKGISNFFARLAVEWHSVALYVDDIQWLDQSSQLALKMILDLSNGRKFFFLGTSRDDSASRESLEQFKEKLTPHLVKLIEVSAFDQEQIECLFKEVLGTSNLDSVISKTLLARCKGNPLIAIEYLRGSIEQGYLVFKNGEWILGEKDFSKIELSENVYDLIVKRIESCSSDAKNYLIYAAIYGNGFNENNIADAAGVDAVTAQEILMEVAPLGLIEKVAGKKWRFSHDKIAESLMESISTEDAKERHDKLALLLDGKEQRSIDELFIIARLYMRGNISRHADKAVVALMDAGANALSNYAYFEGYTYLKFAYDLIEAENLNSAYVTKLAPGLATCATILGNWKLAQQLSDLALSEAKADSEIVDWLAFKVWSLKNEGNIVKAWEYFKVAYDKLHGRYPLFLHWKVLTSIWYWYLCFVLDLVVKVAPGLCPTIAKLSGLRIMKNADMRKVSNLLSDSVFICFFRWKFIDIFHLAHQLCVLGYMKSNKRTLALGHSCLGYSFALLRLKPLAIWHFNRAKELGLQVDDKFLLATIEYFRIVGLYQAGVLSSAIPETKMNQELFANYLNPMELSNLTAQCAYELMETGRYREATPYLDALTADTEMKSGKACILFEMHARNQQWLFKKMVGQPQESERLKKIALKINNEYRFWQYLNRAMATTELKERSHLGYVDDVADELLALYWPKPGTSVDQYSLVLNILESVHVLANRYEDACKKDNNRSDILSTGRALRHALRFMYLRAHIPLGRAILNYLTGRYYQISGKFEIANQYFNLAKTVLRENGLEHPRLLYDIFHNSSRICKIQKNQDELNVSLLGALNIASQGGWREKLNYLSAEFKFELDSIALLKSEFDRGTKTTAGTQTMAQTMAQTAVSRGRGRNTSTLVQTSNAETTVGGFESSRYLDAFLNAGSAFTSSIDPIEQSNSILNHIVKLFAAERGFIFVKNDDDANLQMIAGRSADGRDIELKSFSNTVVKKVFEECKPLVFTGTEQGEAIGSESAVIYNLRSIMATPLVSKDKVLGVVYLDSSMSRGLFTEADIDIFGLLANYVSVALELSLMAKLEIEKNRLKNDLELQSAVALESKKVQILVDNMEQALFSVDSSLTIIEPVSKFSDKLFGEPVSEKNVLQTLFKDMDQNSEEFSKLQSAISLPFGEDELQWDLSNDQIPRKISYSIDEGISTFRLKPTPLWDDNSLLEKILFVVEDITKTEELEKDAVKFKRETAVLSEVILNDLNEVRDFLVSATNTLVALQQNRETLLADGSRLLLRELHTQKGNSRLYWLSYLSNAIHNSESVLAREIEGSQGDADKLVMTINDEFSVILNIIREYQAILEKLSKVSGSGVASPAIETLVSATKSILPQLNPQDAERLRLAVQQIEFVSVGKVLRNYDRMVKDIASQLGKDIAFQVNGDALIEPATVKNIQECCLHLIRNSIDHGIEDKSKRVSSGKSEIGSISVTCALADKNISITIEDDGGGMDADIIARKAIEKGIIKQSDLTGMTSEDKLALILTPNFSTKDTATDVSGRGIGMDVVKTNIENMGGKLKMDSVVGKGTKFSIILPAA